MCPDLIHPAAALAPTLASAELAAFALIFAGVSAVTLLAFAGWATYHLVRLVVVGLYAVAVWPFRGGAAARPVAPPLPVLCPDPICRSTNPGHANFCRQCGRSLAGAGSGLAPRRA